MACFAEWEWYKAFMNQLLQKVVQATHDAIDVIGITVRTSNKDDKAVEDINALWQRFFEEDIAGNITDTVGQDIFAIYHDYEGDQTAPYSFTIGRRVVSTDNIPNGMIHVQVPKGQYALFPSTGPQPMALIKTWETIWSSDLDRTFHCDFELYGTRFF